MTRSKSSQRWLKEHFDDHFVKLAQEQNLRSRAAFKLKELHEKDGLLDQVKSVVDLGAAPGGWCQIARQLLPPEARIVGLDILPMEPLEGVEFIQGDFREQAVLDALTEQLGEDRVDLVLSDLAPNMSGVAAADQARAMYLAELALDFCQQKLKPGGHFAIKLFQGEGFDAYLKQLRSQFDKVVMRKPQASRPRSREVYAVAKGFKKPA